MEYTVDISYESSERLLSTGLQAPEINLELSRYYHLASPGKTLSLLSRDVVQKSMRNIGQWLDFASSSTGETGLCYRTAIFNDNDRIEWLYPNSNTAELISSWLDLSEVLNDSAYKDKAIAYAERLISDPVKGLYRGACVEAHGLAWYWPGDGTYTGGYSMRLPHTFLRLYKLTGDERYLSACREIGRTFLGRKLRSGLSSMVGWCPKNGWVSGHSGGCRYAYVISTYAVLHAITGESIYRDAYSQSVDALFKMQRDDGSFFQTYDLETLEPTDSSVKLHFFSYLFNALAEAYEIFRDERLIVCASKMSGYLAEAFYYREQIPYCENPVFATDLAEADSAVKDSSSGLFWLYENIGDPVCLDLAAKLWLQCWLSQIDAPERPGWHGAIIRGVKPNSGTDIAQSLSSPHLRHEKYRIARCEVWFVSQYLQASKRLLDLLPYAAK